MISAQKEQDMTTEAEREAAKAQAELDRLRADVEKLEAELQRARIAFEREPTEQGFAARAVFEQKAKNARATLASYEAATQPTLDAANRERAKRELAGLREALAPEHTFQPLRDRLERATSEYLAALAQIVRECSEEIEAYNQRLGRANDLERRVGDGTVRPIVNLPDMLERWTVELAATFGKPSNFGPQRFARF